MDEVEFGRYRLSSLIGEGGMGKVYRAHDTMMDRPVAIKVLSAELGAEAGYEERFKREARTAARLIEPHIVPIYEAGEIDGRLYLAMPVIEGIDLHSLLRRDGPMSPQRAVHIIEQLAAALQAAHAAGLVHRDIKPSNVLVANRDFAYLIDFGIAHDAAATKLTSTGTIVGTMAYMAPERFTAGIADARSDVYALACVLHECLTGAQPYPGASMEQQIAGHLTLEPPRPTVSRPDLPATFDGVIATGLAKDPGTRYQSADDLAAAARHALTGAPPRDSPTMADWVIPAPPAFTPGPPVWQPPVNFDESPRRRPAAILVPLILAVLLAAASIFAVAEFARPEPKQPTATAPQEQPYVTSAKAFVIALTTMDYRHADSDTQRVIDLSTGEFHDDFAKRRSDFAAVIKNSQSVTEGSVQAAALESLRGTTAQVIVAATSNTSNASSAKQDPRKLRISVQVENISGTYKASKVEFVP